MALKRRHEGAEMAMNNKPLTQNYDNDKEKSEIDSDIRILKIRQQLEAHYSRRNCILW